MLRIIEFAPRCSFSSAMRQCPHLSVGSAVSCDCHGTCSSGAVSSSMLRAGYPYSSPVYQIMQKALSAIVQCPMEQGGKHGCIGILWSMHGERY